MPPRLLSVLKKAEPMLKKIYSSTIGNVLTKPILSDIQIIGSFGPLMVSWHWRWKQRTSTLAAQFKVKALSIITLSDSSHQKKRQVRRKGGLLQMVDMHYLSHTILSHLFVADTHSCV